MNKGIIILVICLGVISGCATATPVIGTIKGTLRVTTYSSEKEYAVNKAYNIANKECGKSRKRAIIVNEEVKYQGLVDEDIKKAVKVASDVAWGVGQYEASGAAGSLSQSDDYEVRVEFKCE